MRHGKANGQSVVVGVGAAPLKLPGTPMCLTDRLLLDLTDGSYTSASVALTGARVTDDGTALTWTGGTSY